MKAFGVSAKALYEKGMLAGDAEVAIRVALNRKKNFGVMMYKG